MHTYNSIESILIPTLHNKNHGCSIFISIFCLLFSFFLEIAAGRRCDYRNRVESFSSSYVNGGPAARETRSVPLTFYEWLPLLVLLLPLFWPPRKIGSERGGRRRKEGKGGKREKGEKQAARLMKSLTFVREDKMGEGLFLLRKRDSTSQIK